MASSGGRTVEYLTADELKKLIQLANERLAIIKRSEEISKENNDEDISEEESENEKMDEEDYVSPKKSIKRPRTEVTVSDIVH